jgi:hypothetical protein
MVESSEDASQDWKNQYSHGEVHAVFMFANQEDWQKDDRRQPDAIKPDHRTRRIRPLAKHS